MAVRGRRIPPAARDEFKRPFGEPIDENILREIKHTLITVGDVVSLIARKNGIVPSVSVYDGQTERRTMTEFAELAAKEGEAEETAENPAGTVTCMLFEAARNALSGKAGMIRVTGEEDLAVIPFMILAPDGARIVYGDPGKGMRMITVSSETREEAERLWDRMEEFE